MMRLNRLTILFALAVLACSARADWPQYRGATHDNRVPPDGLALPLEDLEPRVLWRKDIGIGYTTAATADGLGYSAGWREGVTTLLCFDPDTGERVWGFDYRIAQYDQVENWPRSNEGGPVVTPAIIDGRLYHTTRDGRIFCLDAKTGELIWDKLFTETFGITQPRWGFSASPVVIGGVIYLDVGKIVAMRAEDGETIWQTRDFVQSYSSPTPFTHEGRALLAAFPLTGLVVVDRGTGEVVAHYPWESNQPCHAVSPVVFDGDKIFFSSGFNTGGAVVRFTGDALELVWESKVMCNTMATSLYHDGHLYGFDQAVLRCVDAMTGDEKWSQRGIGQGTLLAIGGDMLVVSEGGEAMSAPMTPEGFLPGRKTRLIFETRVWSPPTIANGRLYLRGARGDLVCVDLTSE